ncbi:MAG: hypothetical protein IJD79_01470 [Clostridia bacterium]|nr:hypothetical protein [Clostridia bacterium]
MDENYAVNIPSVDIDSFKEFLDKNNVENNIAEGFYDDGEKYKYITLKFPVARNCDEIRLYDDTNFESIMRSDFIKYRGVSNYEAIWSPGLRCIECEIEMHNFLSPNRYLLKKLAQFFEVIDEYGDERGTAYPSELLMYSDSEKQVYLGHSTKEFAFLSLCKDGRIIDLDEGRTRFRITLKIKNISAATEEIARSILEKISNTLFYQMDILYDFPISLCPRRESRIERHRKAMLRGKPDIDFRKLNLEYEYDKIPMSLYWFAQNNSTSPIFMYFALYQVLEYYYPIYSAIQVKSKVQNIIKDPAFNVNKDADIVRLLTVMKTNKAGDFGDEREQLSTTLRHIVSGDDVLNYIKERDFLNTYYQSKESQKLSNQKLRLNDNIGIIDDLSERIYDIRCRIVHNKASEINSKILPMTKNETYLVNDVEILKFLARKAIIANSRPFTI